VSINPAQLFQIFRQAARRRSRYELTGFLRANGGDTVCTMSVARKPWRARLVRTRWEGIGIGTDAQAHAIRAVAMQMLIDIDPTACAITSEWRSLRALRDGLAELAREGDDSATRKERYQRARASFQEAVLTDPSNWLARFNLGTVLRKLDLNPPAAEQFRELVRSPRLPSDYLCAVKYNLAVALQKTDDEKHATEALSVLKEVIQHNSLDSTLGRLALSGEIATWADRLTRQRARLRRARPTRHALAAFNALVETWIARARNALDQMEAIIAVDKGDGEENNVVLAVILNALGELIALSSRPNGARDYYRRSITLLPPFFEPYLNLAALYIHRKRSLDVRWATNAELLLREVQSHDPGNIRSMLLLGELYAQPIFGRIEDAKTQLMRALPDPHAAQRLGSLLLAQHDAAGAVAPLESAVSQEPRDGISNFLLALCALALPDTDSRRCRLLKGAEHWLTDQLHNGHGNGRFRRALVSVQAAISACTPATAGTTTATTAAAA
jgi:tetratricopeptide (TPR) repeat protein